MAVDKDKILNELNSVVSQLQAADCGCLQNVFKPQGHHCNQHMCGHMGMGNNMGMGNPGMNMGDPGMNMGNPGMNMGKPGMNMGMGNPNMQMGDGNMNMANSGMNMGNPGMNMGDPGMHMGDVGMNMGDPGMQMGDPGIAMSNGMNMVDQGSTLGNAGMNMQNTGMNMGNTGMNMGNAGMNMPNTGMNMSNPGMNMGNPGMNMGNPGMNMGNPGMNMGNPGMNMGNPGINMGNPGTTMGNPRMNMGNSGMNMRGMQNMGMQNGMNPQEMFKNTYNYLSENLMKPCIKEIQDDFRSMNDNNTIVNPSMAKAMQGGQPGMTTGQPGMINGQPGMINGQPGMMPGQPGMMSGQPGIQAGHHEMSGQQDMASHPGMQAQQPGMVTGQQGMGFGHPGMMSGQPGMAQMQTDYSQNMTSQNSPSPMGQKILNMWNSSGRKPPNLQLANMPNPGQVASGGHTADQIPAGGGPMGQQVNGNMNQTASSQNPAVQSGNVLPIVGGHLQANSQPMQPQLTQNQAMTEGMGDGRMGRGMGMNRGMPNMKAGRVIPPEFAKMFPGILGPDAPFDPFEIAYNMNPANQQKSAFSYMQNMMSDGTVGGAMKRGMGLGQPGQPTPPGLAAQAGQAVQPAAVQPGQAAASGQQQAGLAAATPASMPPASEGLQTGQPQTIQAGNVSQQQNIARQQPNLNTAQESNAPQMSQPDPHAPQTMYPNEQMLQRMSVDPLMASAGGELPVVAYNPLGQPVIMEDPYKYRYQSYDDGPRPLWSDTPSNAKYSTVKSTASKTNLAARPSRMFTPSKMNVRGQYQYQQPIYGGRPTGSEGRLNFQAMQLPQPGSEGRLNYQQHQQQQQQQQLMQPVEQVGDAQRQVQEQPIKQEPINSRGDISKEMTRSKSKNGLQDTVYTRAPASSWSMGSRLVSPICR